MTRTLGDAFVTIRPDMTGFGTSLQRGVDAPARSMSSRLGTIAKRGAIALGAAGAFGAAAFTKNAIGLEQDFGRTMNQIQAATNTPAKGMKRLQDLAMKMGAQTTFSASDAGKAMLELAHGGMTAATIQGGALQGTMTLAAAGQLDMAEAANTAVKSMGQFGLQGKQMKSVAAALAGAANASSASVSDMSQALAQGGLAANSVGFSIQETTGILAAFSNKGLEGSDAGTSLKTMLDRLVPSTKTAADAMKNVGLMTEDGRSKFVKANGEYKSAAQISEVLRKATDQLSSSERKRTISAIFGSDAQRAATIMAGEGAKGINKMVKATSDQNAAQRMAQANMKGTAGAIETMHGSIETASLAFGQAIKPLTIFAAGVVTKVANGAVPIFQDLGKHLRGLKDVDLSGITKSMAGIDWGKAGSGLSSIGQSIKDIDWKSVRSSFGKGAADTVSVFGVAIGFLADHLDTLARWLPTIIAGFIAFKAVQAANNVVSLAHLPIAAAQVGANFSLAASNRALAAQMAIANNVERVGMLTRARTTIATLASAAASKVMRGATIAWTGVQWALNAALEANPLGLVVVAIGALVAALVIAYKKSDTFRKIVDKAWDGIKRAISWAWENAIKPALKALQSFIVDTLWPAIQNLWKNVVQPVFKAIGKAISWAWDNVIKPVFKALGWYLKNVLGPVFSWLWDHIIKPVFGWIGDKISTVWDGVIKPVFTALGGFIQDKVAPAFRRGVDAISAAWDRIKGAAAAPVNFVIDTVYNKGIREFVNGVLGKFGVDMKLPYALPLNWNRATAGASSGRSAPGITAADGTVLPGFTPRRDVHRFTSATGGTLDLSGGEAVMVPEWTRMVGGARQVARMNKAARAGRMQLGRGGVVWPVPGHDVSTYPGHDGADINRGSGWDDYGDPIRAAVAGLISYVGSGRGYGTGIFTKGNYGELVYGHTSRQHVRAGQFVDPGTLIGNVGNTGNSSAPHLHFGFPGGTFDQAMAVLRGAVPSGGGAGGGGGMMGALISRVVGWLSDKGKGLLSKVPAGNSVFGRLAVGMGNKAIDAIASTITQRFGSAGGGVTGTSTPVNANARMGRQMNAARGWGAMWPALNALVMSESGWRNTAQNPSSTAYGIGQFLDSTWAGVGGHKTSDPRLQIQYMLRYIAQRYHDPSGAWAFKQSHNWYDQGGWLHNRGVAFNKSGKPEAVLNPAESAGLKALAPHLGGRSRQPVRMEGSITITNWATGEARFRGIARDEAEEAVELSADFNDHYARGSR